MGYLDDWMDCLENTTIKLDYAADSEDLPQACWFAQLYEADWPDILAEYKIIDEILNRMQVRGRGW